MEFMELANERRSVRVYADKPVPRALIDEAIRAAAGILRDACGRRDFIMRYGGDEFLVIASGAETELRQRILADVDAFSETVPYRLRMSIGVATAGLGNEKTLEECMQAADAQMYEIKNRHKAAEGKRPR